MQFKVSKITPGRSLNIIPDLIEKGAVVFKEQGCSYRYFFIFRGP
jgi:hypothetical protein